MKDPSRDDETEQALDAIPDSGTPPVITSHSTTLWTWFKALWKDHGTAFIFGWWCNSAWADHIPTFDADPDILNYIPWALVVVFVGWTVTWLVIMRPWRIT